MVLKTSYRDHGDVYHRYDYTWSPLLSTSNYSSEKNYRVLTSVRSQDIQLGGWGFLMSGEKFEKMFKDVVTPLG